MLPGTASVLQFEILDDFIKLKWDFGIESSRVNSGDYKLAQGGQAAVPARIQAPRHIVPRLRIIDLRLQSAIEPGAHVLGGSLPQLHALHEAWDQRQVVLQFPRPSKARLRFCQVVLKPLPAFGANLVCPAGAARLPGLVDFEIAAQREGEPEKFRPRLVRGIGKSGAPAIEQGAPPIVHESAG